MSAKVSFLLTEPNADRPTPIFAFVSFDGKRVKVYSALSVHPRQWLKGEQRAQTRGYHVNGPLNDALTLLAERLLACYAEHRAQGLLPTAASLRAAAAPIPDAVTEPEPVQSARTSLFTVYEEWIQSRAVARSPNTLRTYRTTLRHLRDFAEQEGYAVDFDTIRPAFSERFTYYLLTTRKLVDSAVRKNLIIFKHFLSWAADAGHPVRPEYKKFTWKAREADILTLTKAEIQAIAELDLSARPALDNARALFLLACYTGLRFSDVAALKPEHVQGDRLRLTTQKTRDTLMIPLRPSVRPFIDRLLAGTLRPLPNQKLNGHLKTLATLANITTPTERTRYAGGLRQTYTAPKHEFITTHTARRTFVTSALEAGIRPEVVMRITGHKDLKSFRRYVNVTEEVALREFANAFEA